MSFGGLESMRGLYSSQWYFGNTNIASFNFMVELDSEEELMSVAAMLGIAECQRQERAAMEANHAAQTITQNY